MKTTSLLLFAAAAQAKQDVITTFNDAEYLQNLRMWVGADGYLYADVTVYSKAKPWAQLGTSVTVWQNFKLTDLQTDSAVSDGTELGDSLADLSNALSSWGSTLTWSEHVYCNWNFSVSEDTIQLITSYDTCMKDGAAQLSDNACPWEDSDYYWDTLP